MMPESKAPKAFRACTKGFELGYQLGTVMILLFMAVRFYFNIYFLVSFISFLFGYLICFIATARLCKFFGKLWI